MFSFLLPPVKVLSDKMEGCIDCPLPPGEASICRRGPNEDVLVIAQRHDGHDCEFAYTVKSIVVWDGIPKDQADEAYRVTKTHLPHSEKHLKRRCAQNNSRDCVCQGQQIDGSDNKKVVDDDETMGVSYSFGCSWSTYTNGT